MILKSIVSLNSFKSARCLTVQDVFLKQRNTRRMWKIVLISEKILSMPQRWLRICQPELLQFRSLRQVLKWRESRRACTAIGTIFWPTKVSCADPFWELKDDDDGSESVSWKANSRCFEIHRSYSKSFNLSNIGEFLWNWILKDCLENRCLEFTPSRKREIRRFHVVVVKRRQRKVRKAFCTCKVAIWVIPVAFMMFWLLSSSSFLKLPNNQ